jgi:hypothetical protein
MIVSPSMTYLQKTLCLFAPRTLPVLHDTADKARMRVNNHRQSRWLEEAPWKGALVSRSLSQSV